MDKDFLLRMPVELHEKIRLASEKNRRSMNQQILCWLEYILDDKEDGK